MALACHLAFEAVQRYLLITMYTALFKGKGQTKVKG